MKKRLIAKIIVKPSESKSEDFTLALVDYFNKEFKNNNLNSKRNNGYVKVALNGKYMDKYDSVVVDCCNGKVYLRGDNVKDKYFGRLSKFNLKRRSDAYHCVNYNANRLIHRINKINESFLQKDVQAKPLDLRQTTANILDLRTETAAMSLDEAIKHCEEVAKEQLTSPNGCADCANEHLQLANWLEELKEYRQQYLCDMREDEPEMYVVKAKNVYDLRRTAENDDLNKAFKNTLNSFLDTEDTNGFLQKKDMNDVAFSTPIDLYKVYKDKIEQSLKNNLTKEFNEDISDEDMNQMYQLFREYLQSDDAYDIYRSKVEKISNNRAKDFVKELDNNNDEVGRRIPTKNVQWINALNRDKPFIYFNGEIYFGNQEQRTHTDLIHMLVKKFKSDTGNRNDIQDLTKDNVIGFGHVVGDIAFVDEECFSCTQEEIANAVVKENGIKKVYSNPHPTENYFVRLANSIYQVADNRIVKTIKNKIIDFRKKIQNVLDIR